MFAVNAGLLADIPLDRCGDFQDHLLRHVASTHPEIGAAITETGNLTPELEARLTEVTNEAKAGFNA